MVGAGIDAINRILNLTHFFGGVFTFFFPLYTSPIPLSLALFSIYILHPGPKVKLINVHYKLDVDYFIRKYPNMKLVVANGRIFEVQSLKYLQVGGGSKKHASPSLPRVPCLLSVSLLLLLANFYQLHPLSIPYTSFLSVYQYMLVFVVCIVI